MIPVVLAVALFAQVERPDFIVVGGLSLFGLAFAVNSSLHSYLILAYAGSEKAAEDVGFHDAATPVAGSWGRCSLVCSTILVEC